MPIDDLLSNTRQATSGLGGSAYEPGMSPSLKEQTPGLDPRRRVRDMAMRPVAYARERPGIALSIVGGLIVLGIGTWMALRSRRPTRWDMMRSYAGDAYDRMCTGAEDAYHWIRAKL